MKANNGFKYQLQLSFIEGCLENSFHIFEEECSEDIRIKVLS